MPRLILVGLGLNSEEGITLQGLKAIQQADEIYLETYTSHLPGLSTENLQTLARKTIARLVREDLEGHGLTQFLNRIAGEEKTTAILTPGDPLVATTHLTVRLEALKRKVPVQVIHAPSIISAAPGIVGLFNYKFGPTTTITFREPPLETPYDITTENVERGLHTLLLLDVQKTRTENKLMTISQAVQQLQQIEGIRRMETVTDTTITIGIGGAGAPQPEVKCMTAQAMAREIFTLTPQTLIIPGRLHFMEKEALQALTDVPESLLETQSK